MISIKKSAIAATSLVAVGLAFVVAGCGNGATADTTKSEAMGNTQSGGAVVLNGAGSTFVKPAMDKWIDEYKKADANVQVNYQGVGSGAGISQYEEGTVDFGATDAPASADDLKKMPPTVQVPVVSGPVAVTYNLPGGTN